MELTEAVRKLWATDERELQYAAVDPRSFSSFRSIPIKVGASGRTKIVEIDNSDTRTNPNGFPPKVFRALCAHSCLRLYDLRVTANAQRDANKIGGENDATWSIVARNLAEHANNAIHTDAGAQAAGFERALVAGVTSYAYCLHPVIEHFGLQWLGRGEAEVRFRSPVFDGDLVSFPMSIRDDGGVDVAATVSRADRLVVTVSAWPSHRETSHPAPEPRDGEELATVLVRLEGEYGSQYALRSGNAADQCARASLVHPGVWPGLGNYVFHRQVVRGSWIHTRSIVRQYASVADGAEAEVATKIIERFHRGGERAIADVTVRVNGQVVAAIEHEAIIDLGAVAG